MLANQQITYEGNVLMQYEKVFIDINVILSPTFDFNKYKKVYISITSIEELDGLKYDEKIGYQAEKAIKKYY